MLARLGYNFIDVHICSALKHIAKRAIIWMSRPGFHCVQTVMLTPAHFFDSSFAEVSKTGACLLQYSRMLVCRKFIDSAGQGQRMQHKHAVCCTHRTCALSLSWTLLWKQARWQCAAVNVCLQHCFLAISICTRSHVERARG
jgi:hypothetical protein